MKGYENLIKELKKQEISIPQLATKIDMSKQLLYYHLRNFKKGKNTFKAVQLEKICDTLNKTISFFLD